MAGPLYVADPENQLLSVALDGLVAVFHRPSATTHILAPPAPQILALLADRPLNVSALLARLGEAFEVETGADAEAAMAARLAELEAAGLVRAA
jgi:PqqD family protein of HPr-rel-A system